MVQARRFSSPAQIERLGNLTQRYARYSRSAAGLGNVIGGSLFLIVYLAGGFLDLPTWSRVTIALTPLIYIATKEWLQRRYYQRYGRVTEPVDRTARQWHVGLASFTALISTGVLLFIGAEIVRGGPGFSVQDIGYVAYVAAMPVLVWLYLHTTEEFIVGVGLITQAAVIVAGGHYGLISSATPAAIVAVAMIVIGVRQHREYRRLERDLRESRARA